MKHIIPILLTLLLLAFSATAEDADSSAAYLGGVEGLLNEETKVAAGKLLAEVISDRYKFLDIGYVEPTDSEEKSGWNVKYDLKYAYVADDGFSTKGGIARLSTLEAKLDIAGSYSFNDAVNNDDLSSVKASFAYVFGNFGDVPVVSRQDSEAYLACKDKLTIPQRASFVGRDEEYKEAVTTYAAASERCKAPDGIQALFENARTQFAYAFELDLHAGIEGNQDYSESQDVYGGTALVSATRWPSLRLNLERIDASSNEQRTMLTDDDEYDRATVEFGYQYSIAAVKNLPLTLSLGYRYFHEISSPREIKEADLDELDYWSVSLRVPANMFRIFKSDDYAFFLRYTDGQLPFDLVSDSAIELGFSSNIALLGKLFQ